MQQLESSIETNIVRAYMYFFEKQKVTPNFQNCKETTTEGDLKTTESVKNEINNYFKSLESIGTESKEVCITWKENTRTYLQAIIKLSIHIEQL